jgi:hypothetical protein
MKPPACVRSKWGSGTTCEKPSSNVASKELESKLKEMMAERTKQDVAWFAPPKAEEIQQKKKTGVDGSH